MESVAIWSLAAEAFAMVAGFQLAKGIKLYIDHKRSGVQVVRGSRNAEMAVILQKGFEPFKGISVELLKIDILRQTMEGTCQILKSKGMGATPSALLSLCLLSALLCGVVCFLLSFSAVCALAVVIVAFLCIVANLNSLIDRRILEMREAVPEALRSMESCFRAGQSLPQTLVVTSREIGGALGGLFQSAADKLDLGESTTKALSVLQSRKEIPELSFIAIALDVQHMSGGSIAPVLESARESVEDELELMRTLRVQTAQAKLSANIVTVMPFILIALFSFMSPGFLNPFFSSFLGIVLLGTALIMQIAGVLCVRHMLDIDLGR